jgi:hypothetical protein
MLEEFSRYHTLRTFKKIDDHTIQLEAFDTIYYTGTGNNKSDIDAIDLDGGPFISKGGIIKLDNEEIYVIIKIKDIYFDEDKEYLKVYFDVKKIEVN